MKDDKGPLIALAAIAAVGIALGLERGSGDTESLEEPPTEKGATLRTIGEPDVKVWRD